ncbi:MAG: protocatechuate 3,4-dioxygenase [Chloroflexi bacterium]|nr:protocatechuate 3,4-dioxygenase [Chloroflexota bacterium]
MKTRISGKVRTPTPEQAQGPFYPPEKPADQDADLTLIRGKPRRAQGQVIYVRGRLLDTAEQPIPGAKIEIWHANAFGRYITPRDTNPAPLDPNFQGYGVRTTDAEGKYWFKTVKPGAYRVSESWTRPPHIHFIVKKGENRLITQMYFEGEPLNEKDLLFKDTENKELLLTRLQQPTKDDEPDALVAGWDIVLANG